MKVDKMSISMDPDLGDQVREAAQRAGKPLSGWLADAAAAKLRSEALVYYLADFEQRHGSLTEAEIDSAREELGFGRPNLP
ncbi:MAG TPA: hypothetical protein ENH15_00910 [Actinobacteria bacterium]|nr:hypothetical protein [Actinomycetota bacterium]